MNNRTTILAFVIGSAVGAFVAWKITKAKYESIEHMDFYDEESEEPCANGETDISESYENIKATAEKAREKEDIQEYVKNVKNYGYTPTSENEEDPAMTKSLNPYVISPKEFDKDNDYEKITLTYYEDKLLADDNDELVEDIDNVVGFDALSCFGEYENDTVFVRNDRTECDYEICRDNRKYMDVVNGTGSED